MHARSVSIVAPTAGAQQKDNLCGPFWAARVLREAGYSAWDGEMIDEDLIALRAGTVLPATHDGSDVPPGAVSRTAYRHALPIGPVDESGTSARALAAAIEAASAEDLGCVPLRGPWDAKAVERLVEEARNVGARLIANVSTGRLWGSRPSMEVLLAELDGKEPDGPGADWDVGHFVELELLIRGPKATLVVVHDSYPTLGLDGRHLQPPRVLAQALLRGDGREGGVLAVVQSTRDEAMRALAAEIGLEIGMWNNGSRS